jgi:hypothetical protein
MVVVDHKVVGHKEAGTVDRKVVGRKVVEVVDHREVWVDRKEAVDCIGWEVDCIGWEAAGRRDLEVVVRLVVDNQNIDLVDMEAAFLFLIILIILFFLLIF